MVSWVSAVLVLALLAAAGPGEEPFAGTATSTPHYRFEATDAVHEGPPQPPSRLTVFAAGGPREHEFPAGAGIWRDESEHGYLIIVFMDRRFSAFATSGLDHVDLDTGKRTPLLRGLVFQAQGVPEDLLVGVRRVPREGGPLGLRGIDERYQDAVFELVVIFFDPPNRRWHLVPVRTAPWLPDGNQPWPPGQPPPKLVYVEDGALFVATDWTGQSFDRFPLAELAPW